MKKKKNKKKDPYGGAEWSLNIFAKLEVDKLFKDKRSKNIKIV